MSARRRKRPPWEDPAVLRAMLVRSLLFAAFAATVVAANWAIGEFGVVSIGFGLTAPAGVYFAGAAFGLRDALHEHSGRRWVLAAIGVGATLSALLADAVTLPDGTVLATAGRVALASAVAFGLSELADFAVYSRLRRRWPVAVAASNLVGVVVDSALFLWLAFGSFDFIEGQVVAKLYLTAPAILLVWWSRRLHTDDFLGICQAVECDAPAKWIDVGEAGDLHLCDDHWNPAW